MAMLGDAISHSILFGIVVAYLITQSRSPWIMGMGALIVGLLTTYLSNFLHLRGKLQEDASIGIVFTWLFALGVILISLFAGQIDLDQDCVLYGELAFTPFDTVTLFGREIGPRAFWMLLVVSIFNICCITIGYRKLKLCAFDPLLARSLGIRVEFWHYLLMSLVSLSTVAAFESVGAILVVALLVVPANTAFLFASSLIGMLALASLFGIGSALSGYWLASYFDASISASIALMGGAFFVMALLASQLGIFRHKVGHPV
jgi:manganese/zinc/iron transport system permease protein